MLIMGLPDATEDIPSRRPPLAHEGEGADGSSPSSLLWRRSVSKEAQRMTTKPTYTTAAISGTVGRSAMIKPPLACFVQLFHLSGSGDDVWMTRPARIVKAGHGCKNVLIAVYEGPTLFQPWSNFSGRIDCGAILIKDEVS